MNKIRSDTNLKKIKKLLEDFIEKNTIDDKLVDYLVNDFEKQTYYLTEKQSNNKPYFKKIDLNYPSIVLSIDGKVLEAVLKSLVVGSFDSSYQIKHKDYTKMWISEDFIDIFSSINNQVRVYPIYYLIETKLKEDKLTTIEMAAALEVVRKAGFTKKKFDSRLKISSELKKMIS
ncbi:unnamed protein product [Brachionus calyciflorus]|uniref:Uncharacterized protein n=1 Tax=Brachionus calyciflorus TaxID=104777 RepID=A0A814QN16_9BILA|nr:unnamed protein product [Brachionus calyciflorus]